MQGTKKDVKDRSLISLSWPLILTFAVGMIQPMMDSWFLSRTSETAAAGVGAMLPILGALFTALHAFSQSGASIVSQYIGAKQNSHASSTQTMVLFGSVLLGLALTLVVYPLSGSIPHWMGLSDDPAKYAMQFLSVVSFGFAFRALQTILTALIATHGLTIWNFVGNTITIASNAALNVVFLEGYFGLPKMGVYGVALATALSWLISSGILWMVLKLKVKHHSKSRDWKRSRVLLPDWIRIGLPAAAEPISFQLFQVFITAMVVYVGTTAMTARVFAGNFAALSVILGVGLGSGNQILVAHLVGAHDYDKANKRVRETLAIGVTSGLLLSIVVALLGEQLIRLYTDNPEVIRLGKICLWCDVAVQPFKAVNYIVTTSLRASGDSKFPAIVGSAMMWTLGLATSLILAFVLGLGLPGLWLGMASDELYRSFANLWRWRSGRWKSKAVV
ncbi:MATE family efflux transporter [Fibrobacter sp.]|uniref:MATE family efflux transporter n=1 Tax=Fibrobacter sp. TaxID=35828 RepID=UPI003865BF6C